MTEAQIKLVQFPPVLGVPNASPFCVKVEMWLKMTGIPYTVEEQIIPNKAPKKKIPYIVDGTRQVGDSTFIIDHLKKTRNIDPDAGLSETERARNECLTALIEERIYWQIVYDRWLGESWARISEAFFGTMPPVIKQLMQAYAQRAVRRQLWEQGTSRHAKSEVYAMAERDIAALARMVGDGPYIHGETIRSIDATVFGTIASLTMIDLDSPVTQAARSHANLVAYGERIAAEFFPAPV